MGNMHDVVRQLAEKAAEEQRRQILDGVTAIYKGMYDSAANYTNIIMLGGYAGAFALWSLVGDALGPWQRSWSGLWLLISISVFVLWEVAKMILLGVIAIRFQRLAGKKATSILDHIRDYSESEQRTMLSVNLFWAVFVLPVAIGTAIVGVAVLVHAFVVNILF